MTDSEKVTLLSLPVGAMAEYQTLPTTIKHRVSSAAWLIRLKGTMQIKITEISVTTA